MASPFGNVPEILSNLASQKLSPRTQALEAQLAQMQNAQVRQNLLTEFLVNANLDAFKGSDILSTVMAITGDDRLVGSLVGQREKEAQVELFGEQRKVLSEILKGATEDSSESGALISPAETSRGASDLLEQGGAVEDIDVLKGLTSSTAQQKRDLRFRVRTDTEGNPVTKQFGSDIRILEEEIDQNDQPTGNIRFSPGGNVSVSTLEPKLKLDITNKFNAEPNVRKANEALDAATRINDLLDSNNPIADASIPTQMARAQGEVGNLSEADKAPFGGSRALFQRIKAVTKRASDGKLTDADRSFLRDLTNTLNRAARNRIERIARERAKQFSKANKNLDEQEIFEILSPEGQPIQQAPVQQQPIEDDFEKNFKNAFPDL